MYRISLTLVLLWDLMGPVRAQPVQYGFSQLTTAQGLSNNQVNSLLRDRRGFLWVATMSGLNRYDGYSFRVFRHSFRDTTSIPNNYINRLFEDPFGRVWVRTRNGDAVYDPATERFIRQVRPQIRAFGIPAGEITDMQRDQAGNYWMVTDSGAYYYRTATKRTEAVRHRPNDGQSTADNNVTAVRANSRGMVWLVHRSGLIEKLAPRTHRVIARTTALMQTNRGEAHDYRLFIDADDDLWCYASDEPQGVFYFDSTLTRQQHIQHSRPGRGGDSAPGMALNNNLVRDITQDDQGMIWIGTDHGGITLLDKKNKTARYLLHTPPNETSLGNNSVYDFYRDSSGIIWVGTFKQGISYYHKNNLRFPVYRHRIADPSGLHFEDVNRFVEDKKGNLWIGTNGGGLTYFDRVSNRFVPSAVFAKAAGPNSIVVSLLIDHEQTLWAGTYLGGLYAIRGTNVTVYKHDAANPASIASNNIWEIFEDRQRTLWIGTLGGGLDRLDRQQNRFIHHRNGDGTFIHSNYISAIMEDRHGNLWVGTANGINVLESRSGRSRHYVNYTNDPAGLSNNNIISLLEDSRGTIWVGTNEGLNRFDAATGTFRTLRQDEGMPDNAIQTIVEDTNHTLWLGTPNGLLQLIVRKNGAGAETYVFKNYDETDGLPPGGFNKNAACKTSHGELVFGGANGFTMFQPDQFQPKTVQPAVVLTDFQVFNTSIRPGQEVEGSVPLTHSITESGDITLNHRQTVFSLEFAALRFLHPEKIRYQYKLEGFSDDWLTADSRVRKASFTNLNPGDYVFRVRATNNGIDWNEDSVRVAITIRPPFWKSPVAYFLYALSLLGLLLLARWILLERARLKFRMEQERRHARQLHEVDEMKTRFFTNVSHEFRTQLTLILSPPRTAYSERRGPAGQQRQLQLIHRNAKRLLHLVNQLLDFRKMDVQGLTLRPTRQDIVAFCREVYHSFSALSEKKHISFTFETNAEVLETVFDQDKLERILFNLLSNAFKFTPEQGRVSIRLHLPDPHLPTTDSPAQWLTIQVTDTGIGIATAQHGKGVRAIFSGRAAG